MNSVLQIAENLWVVEGVLHIMGAPLSVRMTIVGLGEGKLLVYSPIACTSSLRRKIAELGEIKYIIGPNNHHRRWIKGWRQHFPAAELFVSEGAAKNLKLHNFRLLDEQNLDIWGESLERVFIEGAPFLNESVLFHKTTKTLIVTDLIQNHPRDIPEGLAGLVVKFIWKPLGYWGLCIAPMLRWRFFIDDREAFSYSIKKLLDMNFERVIVAHGIILEGEQVKEARQLLQDLFDAQVN